MTITYLHGVENKSTTDRPLEGLNQEHIQQWLSTRQNCSVELARAISERIVVQLKEQIRSTKINGENVIWDAVAKIAKSELLKLQHQMDKNFGLSEPDFLKMVEACRKGDDSMYEKIFLHHFSDCMEYLKRHYKASGEDAYDASMETLLEFLKKLKSGKITYGNLRFLFTKMAGQIYLKWIKKESKKDSIEGLDLIEERAIIDQEDLKILNQAWSHLDQDCQILLKAFYYDKIPLNKIAENSGKTPASVRKQKQRCMEKLRKLFRQFS